MTAASWASRSSAMPFAARPEQLVQRGPRERHALGGRLHLDQLAGRRSSPRSCRPRRWSPRGSRGPAWARRPPARTRPRRPSPSAAARSRSPRCTSRSNASRAATKAPVIEAQRVPPSASSTSQSKYSVRGPIASMSTTARSERPIRRWISTVRPSGRPRETSRGRRLPVDAGSIPYSAVSQPPPDASRHAGAPATSDAVQITRVPPIEISADPSALRTNPGSILTGRSASWARPSRRDAGERLPRPRRAMLDGHRIGVPAARRSSSTSPC